MKEKSRDRWKNSSYPEIRVKRVWVNEFQLYIDFFNILKNLYWHISIWGFYDKSDIFAVSVCYNMLIMCDRNYLWIKNIRDFMQSIHNITE